jgi:hypothetical protein
MSQQIDNFYFVRSFRVFVTLLFMGFKAIQLSSGIHLLDPVLAVLNEQLSVLESRNNSSPFALSHLDLPFVNWLLLFCWCRLDRTVSVTTKETKARDQRWDFMQGESLLSRDGATSGEPKSAGGPAASRIYGRKLQKRELLAFEQAKLAAESLKVDQHVDDLLELFENPNSESVPPVLKKAWPSISRYEMHLNKFIVP